MKASSAYMRAVCMCACHAVQACKHGMSAAPAGSVAHTGLHHGHSPPHVLRRATGLPVVSSNTVGLLRSSLLIGCAAPQLCCCLLVSVGAGGSRRHAGHAWPRQRPPGPASQQWVVTWALPLPCLSAIHWLPLFWVRWLTCMTVWVPGHHSVGS